MEIHLKGDYTIYGDKYNTNFSTSINLGIKVPKNMKLLFFAGICQSKQVENQSFQLTLFLDNIVCAL